MRLRRSTLLKMAAVVLAVPLLVGGFLWYSRPNLDARFVGEWEYYLVKDVAPDDAYNEPDPVILKLSADGSANSRDYERFGYTLVDWCVDDFEDGDGHLMLLSRYGGKRTFGWQLESSYSRLTNEFHNIKVDRWLIDQVGERRIALRRVGDLNAHLMLKRVSPVASVVR